MIGKMEEEILYFDEITDFLFKAGVDLRLVPEYVKKAATDIHISTGQAVVVYCFGHNRYTVGEIGIISGKKMNEIVYSLCDYSLYKHAQEIKNGYIAISDKYRCGICGTFVGENGEVSSVKNISSLNIRIPRMIKNSASEIVAVYTKNQGGILIVGEPASGKTTILTDLITSLWNKRVTVIDERREFSAFNLNEFADIKTGFNKRQGIEQAIRTMSPQVIVCDEINLDDISAIELAVSSGVSIIASAHGNIKKGSSPNKMLVKAINTGAFSDIVVLSGRLHPGKIEKIYSVGDFCEAFGMYDSDNMWVSTWFYEGDQL